MDITRAAAASAVAAIAVLGSTAARTAPPPDLEIALSDGQRSARPGDRLDYTIKVLNNEAKPVAATVRVELPATMTFVSGDRGAGMAGGAVSWTAQLPPAKSAEFHYTAKLKDKQAQGVAATACALANGIPRPVVCATDIDPLAKGSMMSGAGGTAVLIGGLALGAGGGTAWWLLRRRRKPDDTPPVPAEQEPRVPTPS